MLGCLLVLSLFRSIDAAKWDQIRNLRDLEAPQFKEFVAPIVQIAANTYRYPDLKPVPGWIIAPGIEPLAPGNGAHALVYREDNNHSAALVVAFRGTDLTNRADLCADGLLFNDTLLDTTCDDFSSDVLDYFSQAVSYTAEVVGANPGAEVLVTGHSLGAALAILVSAHFSTFAGEILPVLSFSAPAVGRALEQRSLELAAARERKVYVIGDEWDFIMAPARKQVGVLCLYQSVKPSQCQNCHSIKTDGCFQCFVKTHFMKHIIAIVEESGRKPVCSDQGECLIKSM